MNLFISPAWVTTDVAVNYKNNITLVRYFDRQWNNEWTSKPGGAKIGYSVQVRLPQIFQVVEGQALVQQSILNRTVPITLNHQYHVGMGWSSADSALLVEEAQRITNKAGIALANKTDVTAGAEVYKAVYFSAGPLSAIPLSGLNPNVQFDGQFTDAVAKLRNVAVPEELYCCVDPQTQSNLLKVAFNQFNPQNWVGQRFEKGEFSGPALGVDMWAWDPNIPSHTTGSFTNSTPLVDGALQTGSTIVLKGFGTYSFNVGDTFLIAGVDATNPHSFIDTGQLQEFTITAAASGSGGATLSISPAIITSGPLQTVTASPANNASVFFRMSSGGLTSAVNITQSVQVSRQSLMFHPEAFAFVMAELPVPLAGANSKRKSDPDAKISMRWSEQWNVQTDQEASRMEVLIGVAPILPYFALRVWG